MPKRPAVSPDLASPVLDPIAWSLRRLFTRSGVRSARKGRFNALLSAASEFLQSEPTALSSLCRAISRQLQAKLIAQALQHPVHNVEVAAELEELFFPMGLTVCPDGRSAAEVTNFMCSGGARPQVRSLRLWRDIVLSAPWHRDRMVDAMSKIGAHKPAGPWQADTNHRVTLLLPFGLGLVNGGNHSLAAGIIDGEGEVEAEVFDLSALYSFVQYDGLEFRTRSGQVLSRPFHEEPGMLFEIGRVMLDNKVQYDAPHAPRDARIDGWVRSRGEVLYEVHRDGRDTGASARFYAIEQQLLRLGIERHGAEWSAILFDGKSLIDENGTRWTFRHYGPRPLVDTLDGRLVGSM